MVTPITCDSCGSYSCTISCTLFSKTLLKGEQMHLSDVQQHHQYGVYNVC